MAERCRCLEAGTRGRSVFLASTLALVLVMPGCHGPAARNEPAPAPPPLRLGVSLQPINGLALLALAQGAPAAEALEVEVHEYPSGKKALEGLLRGTVDAVTAAEVPIVLHAFDTPESRPYWVVATLGMTDNEPRIVARRDLGIGEPHDLAGHRIGTQEGSAVHYFLSLFLEIHAIDPATPEIVFMPAVELPAALEAGTIDAFSMREPFVAEARERLGDRVVVFEEPGLYLGTFHLVATAEAHPASLTALLRALRATEDRLMDDPESCGQLADILGLPAAAGRDFAREFDYGLALGAWQVAAFGRRIEWARSVGLVPREAPFDPIRLFRPEVLRRVAPDVVELAVEEAG